MTLNQFAVHYAKRDWFVFPLHNPVPGGCSCGKANCDSIGKHPRTIKGFQDSTTDQGIIDLWWKRWPLANIGLDCGRSGIVVIDVDANKGGLETWAAFTYANDLGPDTLSAKTGGGGLHVIYKAPAGLVIKNENTGKRIGPGVDVRASGGYIVLPPSLHRSGNRYEWLGG